MGDRRRSRGSARACGPQARLGIAAHPPLSRTTRGACCQGRGRGRAERARQPCQRIAAADSATLAHPVCCAGGSPPRGGRVGLACRRKCHGRLQPGGDAAARRTGGPCGLRDAGAACGHIASPGGRGRDCIGWRGRDVAASQRGGGSTHASCGFGPCQCASGRHRIGRPCRAKSGQPGGARHVACGERRVRLADEFGVKPAQSGRGGDCRRTAQRWRRQGHTHRCQTGNAEPVAAG